MEIIFCLFLKQAIVKYIQKYGNIEILMKGVTSYEQFNS